MFMRIRSTSIIQTGAGSLVRKVLLPVHEGRGGSERNGELMSMTTMIILVAVLFLLFGGGGGYYWVRRR